MSMIFGKQFSAEKSYTLDSELTFDETHAKTMEFWLNNASKKKIEEESDEEKHAYSLTTKKRIGSYGEIVRITITKTPKVSVKIEAISMVGNNSVSWVSFQKIINKYGMMIGAEISDNASGDKKAVKKELILRIAIIAGICIAGALYLVFK